MDDPTLDLIKGAGGFIQLFGPLMMCLTVLGGERVTAEKMAWLCYVAAGFSALSALVHSAGWAATSFGLIDAGYGRQEWHLAIAANLSIGLLCLLSALVSRRVARADANRPPHA